MLDKRTEESHHKNDTAADVTMLTESRDYFCQIAANKPTRQSQISMCIKLLRTLPIALCAVFLTFSVQAALAEGADAKAPADPAKDAQRKTDEFAEAARMVSGPAGSPECVWLGRRVVSRLWHDDLDTAFRHLDLYDRFGCPGPHIQQTFRCVVRQGNFDPKIPAEVATARLNDRVNACWLNPAMAAQPAAASAAAPAAK